ncbi:hypothetical protein Lepto7376_0399 [[Leptolyngbya] sp. PCC 7376]|uniref:hypothetical protein n=1 Tax=[Leptolyngbya] sp. PCC 7376 TaxID=111781 RepID=UPI00029EF7FF|nr:hypothetical protein [[Leptolyngbya] sp. PCC 7376]AFY36837.1 hypothetical protein Lepto7376_0399 [[Leptolyngbya] sp. PCC 7376]
MKSFSIKFAAIVLGAMAISATALGMSSRADEMADCPDVFEGVNLSVQQEAKLWNLEDNLDAQIDSIFPLSEAEEMKIEQLEVQYEGQFESILSAQQLQQIEALDEEIDQQLMAIVPEWFEEEEKEPVLTQAQIQKIDALDQEYEESFQKILTTEQKQKIDSLEYQLDEEIEALLPKPTESQEEQIIAAEEAFEAEVGQLLTPQQLEVVEQNLACEWSEDE